MRLSAKEAKDVKRRIDVARKFAKRQYHAEYDMAYRLYDDQHYEDQDQEREYERLIVNYLMPAVETQLSGIAFREPDFHVAPQNQRSAPAVKTARAALSYEWKEARVQHEAVNALRDLLVAGLGIQLTAWLFETESAEGAQETISFGARPEVLGEEPDPTPNPAESGRAAPVAEEQVREDRIYTSRICPKEFWIDPECGWDVERARYLGWDELRSLEEVKHDPKLKGTRNLKGKADNLKAWLPDDLEENARGDGEGLPEDLLRVRLHHYWEKKRRLHVITSEESESPHLVESFPHDYHRYPVRVMRVPGCPDQFFPRPPMLRVRHPQGEINLCRSVLAMHVRQSSPKMQYAGRLGDRQVRQIEEARALTVVELEDERLIQPIQMPPVQPEIFSSEAKALADIQWILGLSPYEAMQEPTKRLTQDEARTIDQKGSLRQESLRTLFEEHCSGIATDLLNLLQQNAVKTRELPIYDDGGNVAEFLDYTKDEIQGNFTLSVYVGSTEPPSRKQKTEDMAFTFQAMTNIITAIVEGAQIGLNLKPMLRDFLATRPEIRNVSEIVPDDGGMMAPLPGAGLAPGEGAPMTESNGAPPGMPDTGAGLDLETLIRMLSAGNTGASPPLP